MASAEEIKEKLEKGLPGAKVEAQSDGRHASAIVRYKGFEGKSLVEQHQMVYEVLRKDLDSEYIHALQLKTLVE